MSIRFEMRDIFGDGITVEVMETSVCFHDGGQNFNFTKEQFFAWL